MQHFLLVNGQWEQQTAQDVSYSYDTNPLDGSFTQNGWGRLTALSFNAYNSGTMAYLYSYNTAGRVTAQRMRLTNGNTVDLTASYTWDNQGRMTSMGYPGSANRYAGQDVYTYQYDAMGRLCGMTTPMCDSGQDPPGCVYTQTVATATYNSIGQMSALSYDNFTENRSYNSLLQLSRMWTTQSGAGTVMDMTYNYTGGRIMGGSRRRWTR